MLWRHDLEVCFLSRFQVLGYVLVGSEAIHERLQFGVLVQGRQLFFFHVVLHESVEGNVRERDLGRQKKQTNNEQNWWLFSLYSGLASGYVCVCVCVCEHVYDVFTTRTLTKGVWVCQHIVVLVLFSCTRPIGTSLKKKKVHRLLSTLKGFMHWQETNLTLPCYQQRIHRHPCWTSTSFPVFPASGVPSLGSISSYFQAVNVTKVYNWTSCLLMNMHLPIRKQEVCCPSGWWYG